MPTNRTRRARSWQPKLHNLKIEELWYGPGSCLLAGMGYWHGDFFWHLSEEKQRAVVAEMRADWFRHREEVLDAWGNRDEHQVYIWREHHSEQLRPWALEEFGAGE